MEKIYDVIIIGAGPAGLAAGLYAGRARLSTLIIEKDKEGGQIVQTGEIENYPGGIPEETGPSLIGRMVRQTENFGVERVNDNIEDIDLEGEIKTVVGKSNTYKSKTIIIAGGATPIKIGCPGEEEFTGKGVSYCATCDAPFFEDLETFVVGGGDSAIEEALHLSKFATKVTIVHRRDQLRAAKSIQEKAFQEEKINFIWDSAVKEIKGDGIVESIIVENLKTGKIEEIIAKEEDGTFGVFVFIGFAPQTKLYEGKLNMKNGYIEADEEMRTNIEGVFAAGDIRKKSLRQVVTAVSDGAIAAVNAEKYIEEN